MQVQDWLDSLTAALDAYSWLFQHDLVSPVAVFGVQVPPAAASRKRGSDALTGSTVGSKSALLASLRHFIAVHVSDLAFSSLEAGPAGTPSAFRVHTSSLTPKQIDSVLRLRAICVCRLFSFVTTLLAHADGRDVVPLLVSHGVLCPRMYRLVVDTVLRPSSLGIDTVDSQVNVFE